MGFSDFFDVLRENISSLTVLEITATALLIIYVVLISKERAAGWPFGIAGSGIFIFLSIRANYYMDAGINLYYVAAGFYGWYVWGMKSRSGKKRRVRSLQNNTVVGVMLGGLLLTAAAGVLLNNYTDNSWPFVDAFTTVFAFIATYLAARKLLENWLIWIVVDIVGAVMYFRKGFYFLALLFVIYTVVAFYGYFSWKKNMKKGLKWSKSS